MDYVYHMVPKKMIGEVLIPLNEIQLIYPELYNTYSKKYFDHPRKTKPINEKHPQIKLFMERFDFFTTSSPLLCLRSFTFSWSIY